MVHILFLAAGSSRRFGANKLLTPLHGEPVFCHGLHRLARLTQTRQDCDLIVLSRYEEVLQTARRLNVRAVASPQSGQGVSYTIRAGIRALGSIPLEDYLLFVLADQPWLTEDTILKMLDAAQAGCLAAAAAFKGRPGSPTLFSAALVPQLLDLKGDQGGRRVLAHCADQVQLVEVQSARELMDVDVPADLAKGEQHP